VAVHKPAVLEERCCSPSREVHKTRACAASIPSLHDDDVGCRHRKPTEIRAKACNVTFRHAIQQLSYEDLLMLDGVTQRAGVGILRKTVVGDETEAIPIEQWAHESSRMDGPVGRSRAGVRAVPGHMALLAAVVARAPTAPTAPNARERAVP